MLNIFQTKRLQKSSKKGNLTVWAPDKHANWKSFADDLTSLFLIKTESLTPYQNLKAQQQALESLSRRAPYWVLLLLIGSSLIFHFAQWKPASATNIFTPKTWCIGLDILGVIFLFFMVRQTMKMKKKSLIRKNINQLHLMWFLYITGMSLWWSSANHLMLPTPPTKPGHNPEFFLGDSTFFWMTLNAQVATILLLSRSYLTTLGALIMGVGLSFWLGVGHEYAASRPAFLIWFGLQLTGYCAIAWFMNRDYMIICAQNIFLGTAVSEKNHFIAAISHDLRNPITVLGLKLTAIKTTYLNRSERFGDTAHLESEVNEAIRQVEAMHRMIDGALDLSKIESKTWSVNVREVSLPETILEIAGDMRGEAQTKGLKLTHRAVPYIVKTDREALIRIIRNLLANAIRYTDRENARIMLGCQKRGNYIRISVIDQGKGIPSDRCEDIFKEYVQLENQERNREKGFGLGLSIVKGLAELLQHKLEVRSREGSGSRFSVFVPIASKIPVEWFSPEASPVLESVHDLTGMIVIIIEDNADILWELTKQLIGCGCYVIAGESSADVIRQLKQESFEEDPHLILSDYWLKDEDGFDAIQAVRSIVGKDIPAALWSADSSSAFQKRAAEQRIIARHKPDPQIINFISSYHFTPSSIGIDSNNRNV